MASGPPFRKILISGIRGEANNGRRRYRKSHEMDLLDPGTKGRKILNKTCWEQGVYNLLMEFPNDYPLRPPKCKYHE